MHHPRARFGGTASSIVWRRTGIRPGAVEGDARDLLRGACHAALPGQRLRPRVEHHASHDVGGSVLGQQDAAAPGIGAADRDPGRIRRDRGLGDHERGRRGSGDHLRAVQEIGRPRHVRADASEAADPVVDGVGVGALWAVGRGEYVGELVPVRVRRGSNGTASPIRARTGAAAVVNQSSTLAEDRVAAAGGGSGSGGSFGRGDQVGEMCGGRGQLSGIGRIEIRADGQPAAGQGADGAWRCPRPAAAGGVLRMPLPRSPRSTSGRCDPTGSRGRR